MAVSHWLTKVRYRAARAAKNLIWYFSVRTFTFRVYLLTGPAEKLNDSEAKCKICKKIYKCDMSHLRIFWSFHNQNHRWPSYLNLGKTIEKPSMSICKKTFNGYGQGLAKPLKTIVGNGALEKNHYHRMVWKKWPSSKSKLRNISKTAWYKIL